MKIIITESQLKTLINEEDKLLKTYIKSPFGDNPVLPAFMRKVNAMSNLNNDNVNIDNIVETEGAEKFIGLEDIALNDEQIEGPNEESNEGPN